MRTTILLLSLFIAPFLHAQEPAALSVSTIFSDHMVLQRGIAVPVWGWAASGEKVTVAFAGQEKSATAGRDGKWSVKLDKLEASAEPRTMKVSGKSSVEIKDVLVGEVWVCSGQSNMQWSVRQSANATEEIANGKHPGIRMINVTRKTNPKAREKNISGSWAVCSPETVANFSAVGYFFGRHLHQELKVPVGLINSSWGGTRSEAWTSLEALQSEAAAAPIIDGWKEKTAGFDAGKAKANFDKQLANWEKKVAEIRAKAKAEGKKPGKLPRKPRAPQSPAASQHHHSTLFNAMIAPLLPYGIKGSIWYQGESNASRAKQYESIFPLMISDWRKQWNQVDFPFYFVQLANFKAASSAPGVPDQWAELQWSQFRTLQLKNTGMATINDIGAAKNIHPANKQDVGKRLALWALNKDYGKDIVYSGPLYKGHKIKGDKVIISFDQAAGLKSRDGGPLKRFEIAGEDKKWHWADATIKGETVVVSSADVAKPVAVRYAWAANPEGANLVNGEGLPASLFKTDDWEWSTAANVKP